MRFDKFTIKSQELIQSAHQLATDRGHQQIEGEHLMLAMLAEPEGVAPSLLRKLGISVDTVMRDLTQAVEKLPRVSGGSEVHLSAKARAVLDKAFSEAAQMKDEYVSIEHIFLALCEEKQGVPAQILKALGVTRDAILKALLEIRGNQRITDPNPEEKYQKETQMVFEVK